MSSVLWSFMNCLAVVFVKEDFLSTFLKRKKNRWIFICIWMFYFLFHFMTKVENYIINLIQDATVTAIVCWLGYEAALRIKILVAVLSVAIGALSEEIIVVLLINIKGSIDGTTMQIWKSVTANGRKHSDIKLYHIFDQQQCSGQHGTDVVTDICFYNIVIGYYCV